MAGVPAHANKSCPTAPIAAANVGLPKMMMSMSSTPTGMAAGLSETATPIVTIRTAGG